MKVRWIGLVALLLTLVSAAALTYGQADDSPLLTLLALAPDRPHGDLYYNDLTAIAEAYPPAQMFADWAEFDALSADTAAAMFPQDIWWRVFMNFNLPFAQYFMLGDEMPVTMGIDFFQIERVLVDAQPPNQVYYLQGDFDVAAIRTALTERDFALESETERFELWCGADGCENSNRMRMDDIDPSDLFGGDLGRQWARLVSPDLLIGANQFADLQTVERALRQDSGSLADNSLYQAAANAVGDQGVLLQALILSDMGVLSFSDPATLINPRLTPDELAASYDRMLEAGFETLPRFDLLMLADLVTEAHQVAEVILVYRDEADAETAARLLPERIEVYRSFVANRMLTDVLEDRLIEPVKVDVVPSGAWSVVRLAFATPKATPEEIAQLRLTNLDPPDVTAPGLVYRLFLQSYFARDLGWLTTIPREDLETLAGN